MFFNFFIHIPFKLRRFKTNLGKRKIKIMKSIEVKFTLLLNNFVESMNDYYLRFILSSHHKVGLNHHQEPLNVVKHWFEEYCEQNDHSLNGHLIDLKDDRVRTAVFYEHSLHVDCQICLRKRKLSNILII